MILEAGYQRHYLGLENSGRIFWSNGIKKAFSIENIRLATVQNGV
jgi:hypothetical protein